MITETELLNWGIKIGFQAKKDDVKVHQLENLIESLEGVEENNALLFTAAFAKRQASRKEEGRSLLGKNTARTVIDAMKYLHEHGAGRNEARKVLGFAKWVFEALEGADLPSQEPTNLEEFVRIISTKRG